MHELESSQSFSSPAQTPFEQVSDSVHELESSQLMALFAFKQVPNMQESSVHGLLSSHWMSVSHSHDDASCWQRFKTHVSTVHGTLSLHCEFEVHAHPELS